MAAFSASPSPPLGMSILDLPRHVMFTIFEYVPLPTLIDVLTNVCSEWRATCAFPLAVRLNGNPSEDCVDLSAVANVCYMSVSTILKKFAYTFKYSKRIKITACFELDDDKLVKLAKCNPQLSHLYLYGCKHISGRGIRDACAVLSKLELLDVRECSRIEDSVAEGLLEGGMRVGVLSDGSDGRGVELEVLYGDANNGAVIQNKTLVPYKGDEDKFEECCKILHLSPTPPPTLTHLKKVYVKLSRELHPDKHFSVFAKKHAHSKFIELDDAYKYLLRCVR